mgnify:CR=1 FL=1
MNKKSILLLVLIAGLNVSNIQPNRFKNFFKLFLRVRHFINFKAYH